MSIKKLQRYRINNCADIADDKGGYCDSADVTELEATNAELVKALEDLMKEFIDLGIECGCDMEHEVIAARKALASAKGE